MKTRVFPVAGLLFLSGLCALVFQVAWFRQFHLVFGASTAASAAVLAIFMGGLGLGNALLGRRVDRHPNPLAFYARLEFSIAVCTALSPFLLDLVRRAYMALGGQSSLGVGGATVVRLLLSTLVLGVPTFLMGGTLPAAARAVTTADDENRRDTAVLYGLNTLGAVGGALLSTFFALEFFGTRLTLWLACLVNTGTSLMAWGLSRRPAPQQGLPAAAPRLRKSARRKARRSGTPCLTTAPYKNPSGTECLTYSLVPAGGIYAAAGIVGFAFFLMELVWYRMLGPLLGGSTFTFGLILAVALLGIGLGGATYALVFHQRPVSLGWLALSCGLEAACIAIPFALGDRLALWTAWLHQANKAGFSGEVLGWVYIASIVILPAALVSGVQFPLLIALLGRGQTDLGKQIGLAVAWNTVGDILGSLAGGFGLLPLLSAPGVWRAVVVLLILLSAALAAQALWVDGRRRAVVLPLASILAAAIAIVQPGPSAVWRHSGIGAGRAFVPAATAANALRSWENLQKSGCRWQVDGVESSVAVELHNGLAFIVNGKSDGNALGDAPTQIMLGLVGGILHPHPKTVFVVGLGTGETAGWLAEMPSAERIDVVELEPAIDEVARRCTLVNHDVLHHRKVYRTYNDAREVLLTAPRRYDLIVSEPSNPYRSGIASLFTQEFYLAGRERLNEGGLFLQWLQGYEVDERTVGTVLATLRAVYPHVEIWLSNDNDLLLLASLKPIAYPVPSLRQRIGVEPFRTALACTWRVRDLEGFLAHYVGGPGLVKYFVTQKDVPLNSDDRNHVEYGFARTLGHRSKFNVVGLRSRAFQLDAARPPLEGGDVDWEGVDDQWRAIYVRVLEMPPVTRLAAAPTARWLAMTRFAAQDWRGAIDAWQSQPRPAASPTELALLAYAYAQLGDARAAPLAAKLLDIQPTEAVAIAGILYSRQQRFDDAADTLVTAFQRLRDDPWPLLEIISDALDTAVLVARRNHQHAAELLASIEEPFALGYIDEKRRMVACKIAPMCDRAQAARLIATFEPNVPWTKPFLKLRQEEYAATSHPLAEQARKDFAEFTRQE